MDLTFTLHSALTHHCITRGLKIMSVVNKHATHSTARCDAVVTVRTYSDDSQCLASGDARPIAGSSELGIMNEAGSNCGKSGQGSWWANATR